MSKNRHKKVSELSAEELEARREQERIRKQKNREKAALENPKPVKEKYVRKLAGDEMFIGIDGEGVDAPDGTQRYAMLVASTGEYILDPEGLSSRACFKFLAELGMKYPSAILVCYGASYDINMMLRDVPREQLEILHGYVDKEGKSHDANDITWMGYRIKYRPRKEMWLGLFDEPKFLVKPDGTKKPNYQVTARLWDVIGFFQGAFVKSVESYLGKDHAKLAMIKEGKRARGSFTREQLESFVLPYCQAEVEVLVELMDALRSNLQAADLHISRWDGAGACAMALLKRENIKEHMQRFPKEIHEAAQFAYAGGRIELQWYGNYNGIVYHYDLRSAYPAAMLLLPSLAGGKWRHLKKLTPERIKKFPQFAMYRVEWDYEEKKSFYPFPYREHTGSIRFPRKGHNWVWAPELLVALDFADYFGGTLIIHEAYVFVPAPEMEGVRPFAFLTDLYEQRKKWKKEGNGAEKAMKLAINSLYGKQVQHVGYHGNGGEFKPNLPPFHQLEWGGFVTSYTRGALLRAAMQMPDAIIAFATDGIFSTVPLDLPCEDKLGNWEDSTHDYMTIVQSGVYWVSNLQKSPPTDEDRTKPDFHDLWYEKDGQWWKGYAYYRGFDQGAITRNKVLEAWKEKKTLLPVECSRFVTLGTALVSDAQFAKWRTWVKANWDDPTNRDGKRSLQLTPTGTKRTAEPNAHKKRPDKKLIRTYPTPATFFEMRIEEMSMKYKLPWEKEEGVYSENGLPEKAVEAENEESQY